MINLRIAYVYDNIYPYYVGGVEKRVWELATRISKRGHEVHWYGMKYWDGPDIIDKNGIWLHGVCPAQELYVNGRRSIREALYFAWKLLKPLAEERYDIIDCQNAPYFPVFSSKACALLRRCNLIVTWHEVWDRYWYEYLGKIGLAGQIVERIAAMLSSRAIAVSEATRKELIKIGVKERNITVIPNGVDIQAIEQIPPANNSVDILYAGRLIKEKGVHILVKALDILRKKKPDISCLIIGDGPERKNLEKLTRELKLQSNIHFAGFLKNQKELIAQMKSAKIFVLPSVREGFGIVVIEANACGVPVITTNHPRNAAKDLVIQNENGLLFEGTCQDLAEKITKVLSKNNWKNACKKQSQKYDWDIITSHIEGVYKTV